jgi:hypothetical protein
LDELALYSNVDFDCAASSSFTVRLVEIGRMFWELEKCFKPCDGPHRRITDEGIAQNTMIHVNSCRCCFVSPFVEE